MQRPEYAHTLHEVYDFVASDQPGVVAAQMGAQVGEGRKVHALHLVAVLAHCVPHLLLLSASSTAGTSRDKHDIHSTYSAGCGELVVGGVGLVAGGRLVVAGARGAHAGPQTGRVVEELVRLLAVAQLQ